MAEEKIKLVHLTTINLTKTDFEDRPWMPIINATNQKECWYYGSAFFVKANEAEIAGDLKMEEIFVFLAVISNLHLDLDTPNNPFHRLPFPFSSQQLDLVHNLVPEVEDPELQARMADIVWTFQREGNLDMREVAVNAYLASATRTEEPENWVACERNIERAFQIALNSKLFPIVFQHIEKVLARMNGEDLLYLSAKLMRLLYQHGLGDPLSYAALATRLALHAEAASTWDVAREYWDITAEWHKRSKNQDSRTAALLSGAETYVKEAEEALSRPSMSHMLASSHLEHAITALQRMPDMKMRVDELHKLLLEYQKKSLEEMALISTDPIDITKIVDQAVHKVKDKSLRDALFALALLGKPQNINHLRQQAEKQTSDFVFQSLFPIKIMNAMGRTIAREAKTYAINSEEAKKHEEESLLGKMFQNASHGWHLHIQACTEPARYQINSEHNIRIEDFLSIVTNNPFVPPGRELLYAKGLSAGMSGDFSTAVHLLIPQIEHSVRYILAQQDIITTAIGADGIQADFDLNKTLKAPQYKEPLTRVFGEDLIFSLRGILVERFGANLRNDMAHGLLDASQFYSAPSCYLWWLTLRLCCLPVIAAQLQSMKQDDSDKGNS